MQSRSFSYSSLWCWMWSLLKPVRKIYIILQQWWPSCRCLVHNMPGSFQNRKRTWSRICARASSRLRSPSPFAFCACLPTSRSTSRSTTTARCSNLWPWDDQISPHAWTKRSWIPALHLARFSLLAPDPRAKDTCTWGPFPFMMGWPIQNQIQNIAGKMAHPWQWYMNSAAHKLAAGSRCGQEIWFMNSLPCLKTL